MFWIGFFAVFIVFIVTATLAKFTGKVFDRLITVLGRVKIVICTIVFTLSSYMLIIMYALIAIEVPDIVNAVVCGLSLVLSWIVTEKLYELVVGKESSENKILTKEDKNLCHLSGLIGVITSSLIFYKQNGDDGYVMIISIVLGVWIGAYVPIADIFDGIKFSRIMKNVFKCFNSEKRLVLSSNVVSIIVIFILSLNSQLTQIIHKFIEEMGRGVVIGTIVLVVGVIIWNVVKKKRTDNYDGQSQQVKSKSRVKMIKLTANEQRVYENIITNVIPNLTPGNYMVKDFFGADPTNPRIARKIYEEVKNGSVERTSLVGTKSEEGYKVE